MIPKNPIEASKSQLKLISKHPKNICVGVIFHVISQDPNESTKSSLKYSNRKHTPRHDLNGIIGADAN